MVLDEVVPILSVSVLNCTFVGVRFSMLAIKSGGFWIEIREENSEALKF